jgi:hypothetical protein
VPPLILMARRTALGWNLFSKLRRHPPQICVDAKKLTKTIDPMAQLYGIIRAQSL